MPGLFASGAPGEAGHHTWQVVRTPLPRRRPDDRSQVTTTPGGPPGCRIRIVTSSDDGSDDLVQPRDGTAVTGMAVDLEIGVPGRAEELVHAVPEGLDGAGGRGEVP
jgi:hypothetical protein